MDGQKLFACGMLFVLALIALHVIFGYKPPVSIGAPEYLKHTSTTTLVSDEDSS